MTRFLAAQMARSHWFCISRAKADFGYSPAISTAEGMRRMSDWADKEALGRSVERLCSSITYGTDYQTVNTTWLGKNT